MLRRHCKKRSNHSNKKQFFCHFDEGEITLETPYRESSIFIDSRV